MPSMQERAAEYGLETHTVDLEKDARLGVDPFAVWDEVGKFPPFFYSDAARGFFVAADYDTIKSVLQNPDLWSSKKTMVFTTNEIVVKSSPVTEDPPIHTALRKELIPLFSPRVVDSLRPRISKAATSLIAKIRQADECDFYRDFAAQLPSTFFLSWLGLHQRDTDKMFALAKRFLFDKGSQEQRDAIEYEIGQIVSELYAERRVNPADDLATKFVQMRIDGEPIDEDKLVEIGSVAFVAGQETTASSLTYIMWWLTQNTHERDKLVAEPELVPLAIEELLRAFSTPGPTGRVAAHDGEFMGVHIEAGDRVFLARTTADRRLYDDLDLTRMPNRHTAFGLGIHRCLGSHLARAEMAIGIQEWNRAFPRCQVSPDWVPQHKYGTFMQQLNSLPLELNEGALGSPTHNIGLS